MARFWRSLAAAALLVGLSTSTSVAAGKDDSKQTPVAKVVKSWKQTAVKDPIAARALEEFQGLTAEKQERFVGLLNDPDVWEEAQVLMSSAASPGAHEVAPGVELVVGEPQQKVSAKNHPVGGAKVAAQFWNVQANSQVDFKILGIKLGHWRQEYGYTTKTGQYAIVSSDWCSGWWTGFAGFWNISSSTSHYKWGDFGYCKTRHQGSLVFKGSFITVNKEHGQQVAGPNRVSWWLKNV